MSRLLLKYFNINLYLSLVNAYILFARLFLSAVSNEPEAIELRAQKLRFEEPNLRQSSHVCTTIRLQHLVNTTIR